MALISLDGMQFYAFHGCFNEEQVIGTNFVVSLTVDADTSAAQLNDDIHSTVNYQELYNIVAAEMSKPSHLLEHVAHRILQRLIGDFASVCWASVKISKLNPPLGGQLSSASVQIELSRSYPTAQNK